ncbi:MAG TPA: folylpolyglutamate synthase/dihydrofolate synthase family protein [Rectinemataceae bacterium]
MENSRFPSSDSVFEYLMRFVNFEKGQATEFKLDRMRRLAFLLGDPQLGRLTIHIAGSKGKGSVSAMCAAILEESGLKTGLYTSPHLLRWKERVAYASREMEETSLVHAMEEILPLVDGKTASDFPGEEEPTFFELTTLLAFCAFRAQSCEAQVIEVGLGGRLDSTNIVDPDACAITPIELEHTQFLGDSIGKIAWEKAGIIKHGKPACIGAQKPEAMDVFEHVCSERLSPIFSLGKDASFRELGIGPEGTSCLLFAPKGSTSPLASVLPPDGLRVRSPMIGAVQAQNMALAALVCSCALPGLESKAIGRGLAKASLPARFELLGGDPPIVLDGAHTPESIRLALSTMKALFPGPRVLLFACAHDKRHEEMAAILAGEFQSIYITRPGNFKASDPEAVMSSFRAASAQPILIAEPAEAVLEARNAARRMGAALLVAGSFYLCAEARRALEA